MAADVDRTSELPQAKGYRFVRRLGRRPIPTYAAIVEGHGRKQDIVAIEHFARDAAHVDDVVAFTRVARAVVAARPPHVVTLRSVEVDAAGVFLVGDFVDGEPLGQLWELAREAGAPVPVEVSLRIACDVLDGAASLHAMVDASGAAMPLVHGELTPSNVIVSLEGSAALCHVCRVKWAALKAPGAPGYLAPELLLREGDIDERADVYSVGAVLFEALSGTKAYAHDRVSKVIRTLTTESVPRPTLPAGAPWAAPVVDVVSQAMAVDPNARHATASEMKAALEGAASGRIASHAEVASWIARLAGPRVAYRRAKILDPSTPEPVEPEPVPVSPADEGASVPCPNADAAPHHPAELGPPAVILGPQSAAGHETSEEPAVISLPIDEAPIALPPHNRRLPLYIGLGALGVVGGIALLWALGSRPGAETPVASTAAPSIAATVVPTTPLIEGLLPSTADASAAFSDAGVPGDGPVDAGGKAPPDAAADSRAGQPRKRPGKPSKPPEPRGFDPSGI